ncbi:uncharacterized protein PHACADRAFT_136918 [Phanerochaete carnosa HHB-10118-sp]|uniref:RING-type E3 ubiquitin transferase (cysteine targeting) n=1 Tax=Phanerochaete carnosa (strain HHB-10118-sp) TaxID=650164 RepID=K5W5Z8_PHACS|nr:uncharacterized protein PHACADRAFT_136918 [Phanerochaete carnosa HHB-10118-sp]EKM59328.1 hypothetical protein PHACADRAFT_136918 [Phanerochaete carnosa HHB-10118-sp]
MASTSSSSYATWQRIWDDSQARLSSIHESLTHEATPTPRITRVGKLDAELLDQELVQVLQDPLAKALALVNSSFKGHFEPELTLCIQLTLFKFSLWDTGATYGAKLQGLRYAALPHLDGSSMSFRLPRRLLLIHGVITTLVPYFHTRLRAHALSQAWPDAPSSDRRRKAWELLTRLESLHSTLTLLNFVAFMWNGRYRMLADRLLRMRLVSTQRITSRDVSYEFMNRQMVWHAFTEFLLFLLPLINTRTIGRRLTQLSQISITSGIPQPIRAACGLSESTEAGTRSSAKRGKYWSLYLDQCAICHQDSMTNLSDPTAALSSLTAPSYSSSNTGPPPDVTEGSEEEPPPFPIHTPYITDCGHTYCYVCITGRLMRTADEASGTGPGGTRWECLRCGEAVGSAERVQMEGVESEHGSEGTSFEFGSEDLDFTSDMSGSLGDDNESIASD